MIAEVSTPPLFETPPSTPALRLVPRTESRDAPLLSMRRVVAELQLLLAARRAARNADLVKRL
jgi:hypothetical protein